MSDMTWQVSNLDLSKRLKELGVKQESHWYWYENPGTVWKLGMHNDDITEHWSAFTVAELGEMLPSGYISQRRDFGPDHPNTGWSAGLEESDEMFWHKRTATEAAARAKMLIYLIEKGLVKP